MTRNDQIPLDTRTDVQTRLYTFIIVRTHPLIDWKHSVKTQLQHTKTDHHKTPTRHQPDTIRHDQVRPKMTRYDQIHLDTHTDVQTRSYTFIIVHTHPLIDSTRSVKTQLQHTKTDHHKTPNRHQQDTITTDQTRPKLPFDTPTDVQTRAYTFIIVHIHPLITSTRSIKTQLQHTKTDHHKMTTRHQPVTITNDQARPKRTGHDQTTP
jgi:hypothetical protein